MLTMLPMGGSPIYSWPGLSWPEQYVVHQRLGYRHVRLTSRLQVEDIMTSTRWAYVARTTGVLMNEDVTITTRFKGTTASALRLGYLDVDISVEI